jgi:hypothetical protein
MTERALSSDRRVLLGIFLSAFFFYMLTGSRERPWADATPVWEVAQSIVSHAGVDIETRWPYNAPPGRNGKYYATNPLLNSLVHVPGAALRHVIMKKWPTAADDAWPFAAHLAPSALGALACLLFFTLCREHGASRRIASLATVALGVATVVWVYARYPYSEILQTAFFTGLFLQLVRVCRSPTARDARWLGLWAALLISTKTVYAVVFPGAGLVVLWQLRRDRAAMLRVAGWAALMMVPAVALYLFYNWLRSGAPLNDRYGPTGPIFQRGDIWNGLWGLFLSPGKSVFLYSLPILLGLLGLPALARRHRLTVVLMVVTILPVLAVCARLPFWHGDYAWGPRYAVFATPVLLLPLCFALERLAAATVPAQRWLARGLWVATMAGGVFVAVLGSAFHWDHWIRITRDAATAWLGNPNRAGAATPDRGGICDSCFEDLYQLHWIPHFQPIRGHLWLMRHVPFGHDWIAAEKDAPWHPETTLRLNIAASYPRARLDWWVLNYRHHELAAAGLFMLFGVGLAAGIQRWAGTASGRAGAG